MHRKGERGKTGQLGDADRGPFCPALLYSRVDGRTEKNRVITMRSSSVSRWTGALVSTIWTCGIRTRYSDVGGEDNAVDESPRSARTRMREQSATCDLVGEPGRRLTQRQHTAISYILSCAIGNSRRGSELQEFLPRYSHGSVNETTPFLDPLPPRFCSESEMHLMQ